VQAGYLQHCSCSKLKDRSARQSDQVNAAGPDIFTQGARFQRESGQGKIIHQFNRHQIGLTQIGLPGAGCNSRPTFQRHGAIDIAFNTLARDQADTVKPLFGKCVVRGC